MALMRWSTVKGAADVVSGILNWVCPGCGGRMGGRGKEFKCRGECQTDWRPMWSEFCPRDADHIWTDTAGERSPIRVLYSGTTENL
jgi:hypothetical protein